MLIRMMLLRHVDLSNITGAPAPWTLNNLDEQKAQIKRFAAQQLVLNNPDLVTYLQSHPMAASVRNDDWANLDKYTKESSGGFIKSLTAPLDRVAESSHSQDAVRGNQGWHGARSRWVRRLVRLHAQSFDPESQRCQWATVVGWVAVCWRL